MHGWTAKVVDSIRWEGGEGAHFLVQRNEDRWNVFNVYLYPSAKPEQQMQVQNWVATRAAGLGSNAKIVISGDLNGEPDEIPIADWSHRD
eukprot:5386923-Alexandrium_andersonii.AAC.1